MKTFIKFFLIPFLFIQLVGCAGTLKNQTVEDHELKDPIENFNRKIFKFNLAADRIVLKPIAQGYESAVPKPARSAINNFFNNAAEPINFVNNLLQFKIDGALTSFTRFAFNSTLGLGGLIDITGEMGLKEKPEDFGQTLGYWGVKPGPYVVLPFLGPSNIRDSISLFPDSNLDLTNQFDSTSTNVGLTTLDVINIRSNFLGFDKLLETQLDQYTFLKSGYEQSRLNDIFDGEPPESDEFF